MAYTKEYDSDDYLETDVQDLVEWAIFQGLKGASDDDDITSQATDHCQPKLDEHQNSSESGSWDHLVLNV